MGKKSNKNVESFIEVIERNFNANPSFKALIELIGIVIFFILMIVVVRVGNSNNKAKYVKTKKDSGEVTTTVKVKSNLSLFEMLTNFETTEQKITGAIVVGTSNYKIDATSSKGVVSGYLLSDSGNTGFKLKDAKVYEVTVDGELENNELFSSKGISTNYLIPSNLGTLLSENKSLKEYKDKDLIFTYNLEDKKMILTTKDKINSIEITEGASTYNLSFE